MLRPAWYKVSANDIATFAAKPKVARQFKELLVMPQ